ncbi:MAG TPA: O-antigen ligase family protein [Gaiellaceae bacterium]
MTRAAAVAGAAVVCALGLDSGGYFPRSWVWSTVVLLWVAAVVLVLRRRVAVDAAGAVWVAALLALAAWTLLSAVWSIEPAQSVLDARRDLVYVAASFVVVTAPRRAAALLPVGVLSAVSVVAVVGLVRYLVSGPVDPAQGTLLSWPVGYANAFAGLCAIALPLAVALAAHEPSAAARAAAAATVPLFVAVIVVAGSVGGALAAAVALAALVALDVRRRGVITAAWRVAIPVAAVIATCRLADLGAHPGSGARRGLVALVLAAAAVVAALHAARTLRERPPGRELSRRLALAGVLCAAGIAVAVSALPSTVTTHVVAAERADYWAVGRNVVARHPWLGAGAGTFGRFWLDERPTAPAGALDAHNLYLETLAELGPIGLVVLIAFLALPLVRAPADAAAGAAYAAFLVHALVDWDWEMPVVPVAAVLIGGSLLVRARLQVRPLDDSLRLAAAIAAVALAALALLGLRSPNVPAAAAPEGATAARTSC